MKRVLVLFFLAASLSLSAKPKGSVAIVVDGACAPAVEASVKNYAAAITKYDGKPVSVITVPAGCRPEVIRDTLRYLHGEKALEGAVLVGDIPVPMIRRAHHLCTAFKMNPTMPIKRSSVPSDRFYDDFGLSFKYIKSDGLLHYYDLMPDGDQRVSCDIYTARIKPAKTDPAHSFEELICEFLDRAAAEKSHREPLNKVFHFGGHGNSSESFNARIDEERAFYEQFGLSEPSGQVRFLNFDEERFTRDRLKAALADPVVDFAHLHTHGAVGAQYISKEPYTYMTGEHMENVKSFLRSKMRKAADKEKTAAELMEAYGVSKGWLDGWDDPEVCRRDSVRSASVDIVLDDLDGYRSAARVILLDACFNGAFLHDDYVAARYAFGHGSRTMAVTANSVNIIQDHWKNELAGLLAAGYSVGEWARHYMTLESHLFGDPTYCFAVTAPKNPDATIGLKINSGRYTPAQCLKLLQTSPYMNVRLEAFYYIVREAEDTKTLGDAISAGLADSYEMIRRMAARYAETCGDPVLLPEIARQYLNPMQTARVRYHLLNALSLYNAADVEAAMRAAWDRIWPTEADFETAVSRITAGIRNSDKDIAALSDPAGNLKDKAFTVSHQRNACLPAAIDPMIQIVADEDCEQSLRLKAAEALGWYTHAWRRQEIYGNLKKLKVSDPEVADELARTLRRLEDNAHTR